MTTGIRYPAGYDRPVASAARHLLDTIVATFTEQGVELPARRLVTIGSVAVDSPILAVMYGGVAVGLPGNEMNTPMRGDVSPRTLTFNVELWRATPTIDPAGNAPEAAAISAVAEVAMHDSWLLLESAFASDQLGVGVIANATVNPPQGGMVGVTMALETQVP